MDNFYIGAFVILAILLIMYFTDKPKQKSEAEIEEINRQGGDISEGE